MCTFINEALSPICMVCNEGERPVQESRASVNNLDEEFKRSRVISMNKVDVEDDGFRIDFE